MRGIHSVSVGYAGGIGLNPTYQTIKDHTEAVRIEFDPSLISYEDILEEMMQMHSPHRQSCSRQYRSMIIVHTAQQMKSAQKILRMFEKNTGMPICTEIEDATLAPLHFYRAEEYHQKYVEKQNSFGMYDQLR